MVELLVVLHECAMSHAVVWNRQVIYSFTRFTTRNSGHEPLAVAVTTAVTVIQRAHRACRCLHAAALSSELQGIRGVACSSARRPNVRPPV